MFLFGYLIIFSWIFHIFFLLSHSSTAATNVAEHIPPENELLDTQSRSKQLLPAHSHSSDVAGTEDTESFLVLRGVRKALHSPLSQALSLG